jgi:hypothetical protein
VACFFALRALERLAQDAELALTTDQWGVVTSDRLMFFEAEEAIGLDRLGLALQLQGRNRLGVDRVSHQPIGARPEDDLAGAGGLLEASRHVHGVAGDERLATGRIAGHHLTGVDADAQGDGRPAGAGQLIV